MTTQFRTSLISFTALLLASASLVAQGTIFTWTGGKEATPWHDADNWDANGAPNQTDGGGSGSTLGTEEEDAVVVFDAETATNGYMPTETINVSTDWFGSGTSDHLIPSLQVLNGTINLGNPGAQWWHYAGGTVYQVGDGDMGTAAQINTGFNNWTRHFDRVGGFLMTINADGTVNQTGNMSVTSGPFTLTLNGGTFVSSGTISGLATRGNATVVFDAPSSSFTAAFGDGVSTDFADLAAVSAEFGDSFVDNTGTGLAASDNGDGTFTVEFAEPALITSFEAAGAVGVIDQAAGTISLLVPAGTDLATLAPTFTLTSGSCNQTSGAAPSPTFAAAPGNTVSYTVTDTSTDPDTVTTYDVTVTVDIPDNDPPLISSLNPVNGATGVARSSNLEVTFDEEIAVGSGFITIKNLSSATELQIDVTDDTQVSVDGAVLTIDPTDTLALGDEYAVRIDATAIEDLAIPANSFAGIGDDDTWRFTVFLGDFIWTGGSGSTPWHDDDNWNGGQPPSQGSALGTPFQDAIVVFDSETAVNGYMPTDTIVVDNDWNSTEHLMPTVQVLNGTINLGGPGGDWWLYAGGNILQVGDGDMTTTAQVNTSFTNWVRHRDKGGKNLITVNADGTINQTANFQWSQNGDTEMTLNGGRFVSSGTIKGLANRAASLVNFNADGSLFTAAFGDGVDTDFADLTAVIAEIGTSFVNNTAGTLTARDNGDGTFTVGFLAATMTSFEATGAVGVINEVTKTIELEVAFGTDLATLAPTFTLTSGVCDQVSGAVPTPDFATAAGNTVDYVVTDDSTDPDTVNTYSVTVTVGPEIGQIVINLGSPVGTTIEGGGFIGTGPGNLPLPALPFGSILRSVDVDVTMPTTDNQNFTNDLAVLFDPTPGSPGGDFSLGILSPTANIDFGAASTLGWDGGASETEPLIDTVEQGEWPGDIDLSLTGVFLGNSYQNTSWVAPQGGTWTGTITLTYEVGSGGSAYATWSAGQAFDGDKNGDGVSNGMAFLLGAADPDEDAKGRLPTVTEAAGGLVLSFSCLDAASRGSAILNVQWSQDLGVTDLWPGNLAAVPSPPGATVDDVVFVVTENSSDDTLDDVVVTIPASKAANGRLFGRLQGSGN